MKWWILDSTEFYSKVLDYMQGVDPAWAEEWLAPDADEQETLRAILGEGRGRTVLDCSCGSGGQAIPLARLGWQVTGTDLSAAQLDIARRQAAEEGLEIEYHVCDMRELGQRFERAYDWVVSCYALDNITEDAGIQQALAGMYGALKPGGRCYIRLRDFDDLMEDRERYCFGGERRLTATATRPRPRAPPVQVSSPSRPRYPASSRTRERAGPAYRPRAQPTTSGGPARAAAPAAATRPRPGSGLRRGRRQP